MPDRKPPVVPARLRAAALRPAAELPAEGEAASRHGAISRKLSSYSNYKSWAERMRASWVEEPATTDVTGD